MFLKVRRDPNYLTSRACFVKAPDGIASLVYNDFYCFSINMQVPKEWKLDPNWDMEAKQQQSHMRKFPSKWRAVSSQQDPVNTVRIVDHLVVKRNQKNSSESSSSS